MRASPRGKLMALDNLELDLNRPQPRSRLDLTGLRVEGGSTSARPRQVEVPG